MKNENIFEEEIILEPPTELIDEAKEIAQNTISDEKFPFALQYDANQKEFLLSMLGTVGAIVKNFDEEGHVLDTMMNMTQLAFIKQLDCVERVKTDEGTNPFLSEDIAEVESVTHQGKESMRSSASTMSLSGRETTEEATITTYNSVADSSSSSCCPCPSNTDFKSAKAITVEHMNFGCICCPGAEQWFKFTVPETKQYTIYTTGSLDTVGTLYDCCENPIVEVNNHTPCGKLNFRIIETLNANTTYYIRVREAKSNTGSYYLIITSKILVDYVNVSPQTITLEKGKTYELPITPDYTYLNLNGDKRIDGLSVSLSPSNANEQKILWRSSNDDVINITYGWHNDQRYHTITANQVGSAILYASDWIGNGKRCECTVTVSGAGRKIRVHTGDGSTLRVWNTPGTDGKAIGRFADQTVLTLLNETPQNEKWYSVEGIGITGEKLIGWCNGDYLSYKISEDCISFIKNYEELYTVPKDDGYGNLTIGYGHVIEDGETFSQMTAEEADELLREDLAKYSEKTVTNRSNLRNMILTQNKYDAFVSLAYNAGGDAVSDVMDDINKNVNPHEAFSKICNVDGEFSLGLYRRRMDEADMYVYGTYKRTDREYPST